MKFLNIAKFKKAKIKPLLKNIIKDKIPQEVKLVCSKDIPCIFFFIPCILKKQKETEPVGSRQNFEFYAQFATPLQSNQKSVTYSGVQKSLKPQCQMVIT